MLPVPGDHWERYERMREALGPRRATERLAAAALGWRYIPPGAAAHGRAADLIITDDVPVVDWPALVPRVKAPAVMRRHEITPHAYTAPMFIDDPVRPGSASPTVAQLAADMVAKAKDDGVAGYGTTPASTLEAMRAMWGPDPADRLGDYSHALAVRDPRPAAPAEGPVWWPRQHGKGNALAPVWPQLGAHMRGQPAAGVAAALAAHPMTGGG